MPRVLVSDQVSDRGLEILESAPGLEVVYKPGLKEAELAAEIPGFDALVIRSGSKVTAKVLEAATNLKVVGRAGIGVDNVDVPTATRRGIVVMNTPTGNAVTTAEHAIALMMALTRKIPQAVASVKAGKWEKSKFTGNEIADKTLGVLGLGNIGRLVAERGKGLKMKVIGFDPVLTAEKAAAIGVELVYVDELFRRADVISAHTPMTPETKGIVNDAAVEKMKKGVLLVNAARGGIYDEGALLRGLESGKIAGVALDVYAEEPPKNETTLALIAHPRVVCTPHLGASTEEAQERVVLEIAEQVVAYLRDGGIKNAVNVANLSGEEASRTAPWQDLALRLGAMMAQVGPEQTAVPKAIEIECRGAAAEVATPPIVNAALAGYLGRMLNDPGINAVSAPTFAREHGITVKPSASSAAPTSKKHFSSLLSVRVHDTRGLLLIAEGTVAHDGKPRLVTLDLGRGGYDLDAHISGNLLVSENEDRPGVIGAVGTILGRHGINVSRMQVGLDPHTKRAVALWACDSQLPPEVIAEVRGVPGVTRAVSVVV